MQSPITIEPMHLFSHSHHGKQHDFVGASAWHTRSPQRCAHTNHTDRPRHALLVRTLASILVNFYIRDPL